MVLSYLIIIYLFLIPSCVAFYPTIMVSPTRCDLHVLEPYYTEIRPTKSLSPHHNHPTIAIYKVYDAY
jgi:hypothetical protein